MVSKAQDSRYQQRSVVLPSADANGGMRARIKELNNRWETLYATFHENIKNV